MFKARSASKKVILNPGMISTDSLPGGEGLFCALKPGPAVSGGALGLLAPVLCPVAMEAGWAMPEGGRGRALYWKLCAEGGDEASSEKSGLLLGAALLADSTFGLRSCWMLFLPGSWLGTGTLALLGGVWPLELGLFCWIC